MARLWGVAVWVLLLGSYVFVPSPGGVSRTRVARRAYDNNRANQMNRNNPEFWKSRGLPVPPGKERQRNAQRKSKAKTQAGHSIKNANNSRPKDKVNGKALDEAMRIIRGVVKAQLEKNGSRLKGTAIRGSDYDYHLITEKPMTIEQRDEIVRCSGGLIKAGKAALKIVGANIDLFPPNAEWNSVLSVEAPGSRKLTDGAQTAVIMLKKWVKKHRDLLHGHALEKLVLQIGKEKGWSDDNDLGGVKRFSEAQRRLGIWIKEIESDGAAEIQF